MTTQNKISIFESSSSEATANQKNRVFSFRIGLAKIGQNSTHFLIFRFNLTIIKAEMLDR